MKEIEQIEIGSVYLFKQKYQYEPFEGEVVDLAIPLIPPRIRYCMSYDLIKIRLLDKTVRWFKLNDIKAIAKYICDDNSKGWYTLGMLKNRERINK